MKRIMALLLLVSVFALSGCGPTTTSEDCKENEIFQDGKCIDPNLNLTDSEKLQIAFDELVVEESVSSDIQLPNVGSNGVEIAWESSMPENVSASGVVVPQAMDLTVTLTATLSINGETLQKTFTITVVSSVVLSTYEEVFEGTVDETYTVVGYVYAIDQNGFYITDETSFLYVVEDSTEVVVGNQYIVTATKELNGSKIEMNASVVDTYNTETFMFAELQKRVMGFYTTKDHTDQTIYGSLFRTDGLLVEVDGDIFLINGDKEMMISKSIDTVTYNTIQSNVGIKMEISGVITESIDGVYSVIPLSTDSLTFTDLSESEKFAEIVKWVNALFPNDISELDQLDLVVTHPEFGGEIVWGTDNSEEIINSDGTINEPLLDTSFELPYLIKLNDLEQVGSIGLSITGNVLSVSDVLNEEYYGIAKANWNSLGKYSYEGTLNVQGRVILIGYGNFLMQDLETNDFILVHETSTAILDTFEIGDIVTYEGFSARTRGYRIELISGKFFLKTEDPLYEHNIEYTKYTFEEYLALDLQDYKTYSQFIQIEKVYTCDGVTTGATIVGDISYDCTKSSDLSVNANRYGIPGMGIDFENQQYFSYNMKGIFVSVYGVVGPKTTEFGPRQFLETEFIDILPLTQEDVMEIIESYFDKRVGQGLAPFFSDFTVAGDNRLNLFTAGGYAKVSTFSLECDPEIYCRGPLPHTLDDDGNDITPGSVTTQYYGESIAFKHIANPVGEGDFTYIAKVVYVLYDADGNPTGNEVSLEYTILVKEGKPGV